MGLAEAREAIETRYANYDRQRLSFGTFLYLCDEVVGQRRAGAAWRIRLRKTKRLDALRAELTRAHVYVLVVLAKSARSLTQAFALINIV
jgi:hypothetical protein